MIDQDTFVSEKYLGYVTFYDRNGRLLVKKEVEIVKVPRIYGVKPNYLIIDEFQTLTLLRQESSDFFTSHSVQVNFVPGHSHSVSSLGTFETYPMSLN